VLETLGHTDWQAHLIGLPYWVGKVRGDDGTSLTALVSVDVRGLGYDSLENVLEAGAETILTLPLDARMRLASSFVSAQSLFEDIGFVHADMNPPNLFLNPHARDAVLVDFDGGAFVSEGQVPAAWGKVDDFLAPELMEVSANTGALIGVESERWSVGIAISYLLLGAHPLFFLRSLGRDVVSSYRQQYVWPAVDPTSDLVLTDNLPAYGPWLNEVKQLPVEVRETFYRLVDGYGSPATRPGPFEWAVALQDGKPWFESVSVTGAPVLAGDSVTISWWAPRAASVMIGHLGKFDARGSVEMTLFRTQAISLVASNLFGETSTTTQEVTVLSAPSLPPGMLAQRPRFRLSEVGMRHMTHAVERALAAKPSLAPLDMRSPSRPPLPAFTWRRFIFPERPRTPAWPK
jgi:serine/threonine protein kinase